MNLFEFNIVTAERLYICSTMRKRCELEEKGEAPAERNRWLDILNVGLFASLSLME